MNKLGKILWKNLTPKFSHFVYYLKVNLKENNIFQISFVWKVLVFMLQNQIYKSQTLNEVKFSMTNYKSLWRIFLYIYTCAPCTCASIIFNFDSLPIVDLEKKHLGWWHDSSLKKCEKVPKKTFAKILFFSNLAAKNGQIHIW